MLDLVKNYFTKTPKKTAAPTACPDPKRILVATCALLLEIAAIDGEFSAEEQDVILSILRKDHHLGDEEAASLLQTARDQRDKSIDLWRFTSLINQNYSEEEKVRVIETVWKVIYADGRLDGHEDHLVHGMAGLLRLSHAQLIEAKLRAKAS